jgi:microcystin-dependent protein
MSLAHEATIKYPGTKAGDMKIAHYAISYTAGAITMPANDPTWMLLNGASLATATYPLLFALFGYTYGGSGANFNLPDLTEGRVPIGKGLTNFTSLAAAGGEINHTLTTAEMYNHVHGDTLSFAASSHGHSSSASATSDDSHTHTMTNAITGSPTGPNAGIGTLPYSNPIADNPTGASTSDFSVAHFHNGSLTVNPATSSITKGGSVSNAGSGTAHNNMQPYIVVGGWLVKFG